MIFQIYSYSNDTDFSKEELEDMKKWKVQEVVTITSWKDKETGKNNISKGTVVTVEVKTLEELQAIGQHFDEKLLIRFAEVENEVNTIEIYDNDYY